MNHRRDFIRQLGMGAFALSLPASDFFKQITPKGNAGKSWRILFQGDSITDGGRWKNSNDWNHLVGQSYPYLISAKIKYDYPQRDFQFFNRGISGNTIEDLKGRWQKDCIDMKPDLLSILIGINDVSAVIRSRPNAGTVKSFEETYRQILQEARAANPNLVLVLCDPFVFDMAKPAAEYDRYVSEVTMRQRVVKQLAGEFSAIHIPLWQEFKKAEKLAPVSHWSWDGIHPMPAGHELISRAWITAPSGVLDIY